MTTLVEVLEELATELHEKGIRIHWRLQQTLEMTPAQYADQYGLANGYMAASAHIRECIATYKAIKVGDDVIMLAGPMPGKTARVSRIIEEHGLYSLEIIQDGKTVAWGGAHFNEVRKVL